PALNEEGAIGSVVAELVAVRAPRGHARLIDTVIVADNGSTDSTSEVARTAGAEVVFEPERGYGAACLCAIDHLRRQAEGPPDILVFVDGDGSNDANEVLDLVAPIVRGEADLVIGSRTRLADPNSLTLPQKFGNHLASLLLRQLYGTDTTDLGPFRAIRWSDYERLGMVDRDYGWTVEMQVKAAKLGLRVAEIDVHNRARRAGRSKVAGTVKGVVGAGYKIIWTIARYR
ncbi:MAG: glycosyltransferase family 2 protein, partial [Myxococcota bacterium]